MNYSGALEKLKNCGQEHLLNYYEELSETEKTALLEQIELTDFTVIEQGKSGESIKKGVISPLESLELDAINENKEEYEGLGVKALKDGKVAAV